MMGGQEDGLPSLSAHPPAACSPSFLARLLAVATVRPSEGPYSPSSTLHAPKCVRPRPEMNTRARGLPRFGVMSVSPVMKLDDHWH